MQDTEFAEDYQDNHAPRMIGPILPMGGEPETKPENGTDTVPEKERADGFSPYERPVDSCRHIDGLLNPSAPPRIAETLKWSYLVGENADR